MCWRWIGCGQSRALHKGKSSHAWWSMEERLNPAYWRHENRALGGAFILGLVLFLFLHLSSPSLHLYRQGLQYSSHEPLPGDWQSAYDTYYQSIYYYSRSLQRSQWERPLDHSGAITSHSDRLTEDHQSVNAVNHNIDKAFHPFPSVIPVSSPSRSLSNTIPDIDATSSRDDVIPKSDRLTQTLSTQRQVPSPPPSQPPSSPSTLATPALPTAPGSASTSHIPISANTNTNTQTHADTMSSDNPVSGQLTNLPTSSLLSSSPSSFSSSSSTPIRSTAIDSSFVYISDLARYELILNHNHHDDISPTSLTSLSTSSSRSSHPFELVNAEALLESQRTARGGHKGGRGSGSKTTSTSISRMTSSKNTKDDYTNDSNQVTDLLSSMSNMAATKPDEPSSSSNVSGSSSASSSINDDKYKANWKIERVGGGTTFSLKERENLNRFKNKITIETMIPKDKNIAAYKPIKRSSRTKGRSDHWLDVDLLNTYTINHITLVGDDVSKMNNDGRSNGLLHSSSGMLPFMIFISMKPFTDIDRMEPTRKATSPTTTPTLVGTTGSDDVVSRIKAMSVWAREFSTNNDDNGSTYEIGGSDSYSVGNIAISNKSNKSNNNRAPFHLSLKQTLKYDINDIPEGLKGRYIRIYKAKGKLNINSVEVYDNNMNSYKFTQGGSDWLPFYSPTHQQTFYYSPSLHRSTWIKPPKEDPSLIPHPTSKSGKPIDSLTLPGDWVRYTGPYGFYYHSVKRGVVQWKLPKEP